MSMFIRGDVHIHYQEFGSGHPVLLIAPGGMRSTIDFWERMPWNPIPIISQQFRVIAMDQRNAGLSSAPITSQDGWSSYTNDQLALLEHLGIEHCHLFGMCIGGSYNLALLQAAPAKIQSAVMVQPIGLEDNRDAFYAMFEDWQAEISPDHPEANSSDWQGFKDNMYGGDLLFFAASDDFVTTCHTPLLVLMGNDLYHPEGISRAMSALAPNAQLIERWKDGAEQASAIGSVLQFLQQHNHEETS